MEATIVNFRRGRHTQYTSQMLIKVNNIDNKEKAKSLIGKQVIWISSGKKKKEIKGQIKNVHGNNGTLRVKFERGMPGQSIGAKVEIK